METQTDLVEKTRAPAHRATALNAFLLAVGVFAGLWLLDVAYRVAYQPAHDDVTALADGLLLLPHSRWTDWFTQGHTRFFIPYPEWSIAQTGFARPAYQAVIYLAHFFLGQDWSSYLAINYLGLAGIAAVAFGVARSVLRLDNAAALLAAVLVLLSPAVSEFSIGILGAGSESWASFYIGGAFLALLGGRCTLCLLLLLAAVFTKETAVWAPFAAAVTLLWLRDDLRTRVRFAWATAMLVPLAIWLALRFAFYGGFGGTYATAEYASPDAFLALLGWKVLHLHPLFVSQQPFFAEPGWTLLDQGIRIATALLLLVTLLVWGFFALRALPGRSMRAAAEPLRERRALLLVSLWAATGLGFYLLLALGSPRYATAAVMFAWPAMVACCFRYGPSIVRVILVAVFFMSLTRTAHYFAELNPPRADSETARFFHAIGAMNSALRDVPSHIRQVYVFAEDGMVPVTPAYLRAFLGLDVTPIRVVDISWNCTQGETITVAYGMAKDEAIVDARLPDCARFFFFDSAIAAEAVKDGQLRRNDAMTYELPDARSIPGADESLLELGRHIILHVRPDSPARFIVEHGAPDGGLAWFDTPR